MKNLFVGYVAKAILLTSFTLFSPSLRAQTFKVIYPDSGGYMQYLQPNTLLQDGSGVFYGTTFGANSSMFKITSSGTWTLLTSFGFSSANRPRAALVRGSDGFLYGTASHNGSTGDYGSVFQTSTNGGLNVLASFNNTNGSRPYGALVQGKNGNFYGTTYEGGANGSGTIFTVTSAGTLTSLVSFNITNGANPHAGLMMGSDGGFYGTTTAGGTNGYGTVFKVTTNGDLTTLVSFSSTNGATPFGGLIQASDGTLYGTTYTGGETTNGTVFKVTTNGDLTTLISFSGTNGANPYAGLMQASDGNFYGTASSGGAYTNGTIFRLTTNGVLSMLYSLKNTNGVKPTAELVQGSDGSLYGTTYSNIFSFTPPPSINEQPLGATIAPGASALLTVQASATTPFTYQWKRSGTNIASATKSSYLAAAMGQYQVVVSNTAGTIISSPVVVSYVSLNLSNALARLTIQGPIGSQYRIDAKDDLTTSWATQTNVTLPSSPYPYIDPASGNSSNRFYRAVLMP